MNLVEKYLGESASKYKKEFIKYAYEIIDNIISKTFFVTPLMPADLKKIQSGVVTVMGFMALPEGNPNFSNNKKFMPKKFNKFLFDNGDQNTYDSEWFDMTDAKHYTIAREALLEYDKKVLKSGIKRSDLI
jgi:hypothetical protein